MVSFCADLPMKNSEVDSNAAAFCARTPPTVAHIADIWDGQHYTDVLHGYDWSGRAFLLYV